MKILSPSQSMLYFVRQRFRVRLAGLGRKGSSFRADETLRNVTMNLDFSIDLRLAHTHPWRPIDIGTE